MHTSINNATEKWYNKEETLTRNLNTINLLYKSFMSANNKTKERIIKKNIICKNVKPTNPDQTLNDRLIHHHENISTVFQEVR